MAPGPEADEKTDRQPHEVAVALEKIPRLDEEGAKAPRPQRLLPMVVMECCKEYEREPAREGLRMAPRRQKKVSMIQSGKSRVNQR